MSLRDWLQSLGLEAFEGALLEVTGLQPRLEDFTLYVEEEDLAELLQPAHGMRRPQLRKLWAALQALRPPKAAEKAAADEPPQVDESQADVVSEAAQEAAAEAAVEESVAARTSAPAEPVEVSMPPAAPSAAPKHKPGKCKPCLFVTERGGCRHGDKCHFCHVCPLKVDAAQGHPGADSGSFGLTLRCLTRQKITGQAGEPKSPTQTASSKQVKAVSSSKKSAQASQKLGTDRTTLHKAIVALEFILGDAARPNVRRNLETFDGLTQRYTDLTIAYFSKFGRSVTKVFGAAAKKNLAAHVDKGACKVPGPKASHADKGEWKVPRPKTGSTTAGNTKDTDISATLRAIRQHIETCGGSSMLAYIEGRFGVRKTQLQANGFQVKVSDKGSQRVLAPLNFQDKADDEDSWGAWKSSLQVESRAHATTSKAPATASKAPAVAGSAPAAMIMELTDAEVERRRRRQQRFASFLSPRGVPVNLSARSELEPPQKKPRLAEDRPPGDFGAAVPTVHRDGPPGGFGSPGAPACDNDSDDAWGTWRPRTPSCDDSNDDAWGTWLPPPDAGPLPPVADTPARPEPPPADEVSAIQKSHGGAGAAQEAAAEPRGHGSASAASQTEQRGADSDVDELSDSAQEALSSDESMVGGEESSAEEEQAALRLAAQVVSGGVASGTELEEPQDHAEEPSSQEVQAETREAVQVPLAVEALTAAGEAAPTGGHASGPDTVYNL
mmetsp:Transcript_74567/g.235622  ORF Transcript_74567/g.235622 Transcript_74567/m.235622 type:complete len:725 (+) Transcript_74567:120-2294(+)